MPHVLDGAVARVKRAEKLLTDLQTEIRDFEHSQGEFRPQNLTEEQIAAEHAKGSEMLLPEPIPVGILIGEIAYNLRAALDYLVYALAALDSSTPQDGTQFPIEDKPERFEERKSRFLKGLNPAHIAAMERLQPYKGCDWTRLLRSLSNPDKHRHLAFLIRPKVTRLSIRRTIMETAPGTFQHNMEMKDMWGETRVLFPDGTPVVETLQALKSQVADTLEEFKSVF